MLQVGLLNTCVELPKKRIRDMTPTQIALTASATASAANIDSWIGLAIFGGIMGVLLL